jgi:porphobilinogen synthase
LRNLVRETRLTPESLMAPYFVVPGQGVRHEIGSMPGQYHLSPDLLLEEAGRAAEAGVRSLILFGLPDRKDPTGTSAWDEDGPVQESLRLLRKHLPDLVLVTDVCICAYTDHGHCGHIEEGKILNDPSLASLAEMALSHARAGADIVAPSDMMDGRVGAIRARLDGEGFEETAILSYAAKYASGFYGPFREAADSTPSFGDRATYQMDPSNAREALEEVRLDVEEGADMVMVKPAGPYLDVIARVRDAFPLPLAAYQVSGEFAMITAAAANGWLDRERCILESLTAIRRAGADIVLTYFAEEASRLLTGR